MLDPKTVLLIFGVVFLLLVTTKNVIRKQKSRSLNQDKLAQAQEPAVKPRMTEEQFNKSWKSLSYLMLFAAAGNLYMAYNSLMGALDTMSYILWIDVAFSLVAAVIALFIWRLHRKDLVIAYLVITVIPIMIFISTGHSLDGIVHLFPLMLVYFVVRPVWEYME
jgi:high-affinity Fe2+/Pb2+ permease